jgi:RNA polymerase sigma factor (sigma-70 family)
MGREGGEPFDAFYARARPMLLRLAFARTGSWALGEDLVQDAMADAHRRWAEVGRLDNPTAWVRRAVLNRSISVLRRRGREQRALQRVAARPLTAGPDPVLADDELWGAIRNLSARQVDVVLLLWFEDLSVAEVATTLGCGEETVRTHWRRARARLAEVLGEDDIDGDGPATADEVGGVPDGGAAR